MVEQINNYPEECQRLNFERYERLEQRRNRTEGRYWSNSYFDLSKTNSIDISIYWGCGPTENKLILNAILYCLITRVVIFDCFIYWRKMKIKRTIFSIL